MATPAEVATQYQQEQRRISTTAAATAVGLWGLLDDEALTQSWNAGIGAAVTEQVAQAQLVAAQQAPAYLSDLSAAQGIATVAAARIIPSALAGIASDGRPLISLLYWPIILFKQLLAGGRRREAAKRQAATFMALLAQTQVADAGRGAINVGMVAERKWVTYVRVVHLPACGRCIILAGREYSWSRGFLRHPNCDCTMLPRHEDDDPPASPQELFAQMTEPEQRKAFTKSGAEAIRLGADLGQVVNARKGMQTAGGRLVTTEGTTRRGVAGRRMGSAGRRKSAIRPMPEQLLADANGDRDLAVELLKRFGYIV